MHYLFINNNTHSVQVPGPDGKMVIFAKGQSKVLDQWFKRYVPKYLSVSKIVNDNTPNVGVRPAPQNAVSKRKYNAGRSKYKSKSHKSSKKVFKTNKLVGRVSHVDGDRFTKFSRPRLKSNCICISNDIGVGILSYNRLHCIKRLISSIREHTDLRKTTVFVSDESTDGETWEWLKEQHDIVAFHNERGGIACNSNRLLRCLKRFSNKIILNDDVKILRSGWDEFYFNAMVKTNHNHFCYMQDGVYTMARPAPGHDGIITVGDKPHGAVLAISEDAFQKVGYFDESFGIYGCEHVDYSRRIARAYKLNEFYDYSGSDKYFLIHNDDSSDENKSGHFVAAKKVFAKVANDDKRIRVEPTDKSIVDKISYIIPFRNTNRSGGLDVVINCIKAQKFPEIEIIVAEQDKVSSLDMSMMPCVNHVYVKNDFHPNQHFCKSAAFNAGVVAATCNNVILHDADMMMRSDYTSKMFEKLKNYESVHIGDIVCYITKESSDIISSENSVDEDKIKFERVVSYYEGGSLGINKDCYIKIGGFVEDFVGYGCEDTEFFRRIKLCTKMDDNREVDLFHIWHSRNVGDASWPGRDWEVCHRLNKEIEKKITESNIDTIVKKYNDYLVSKYLK
jgi:GT2 family glycosyltransferase